MEYRYLGNSGLKISEITYGNWLTHGSLVENDVATQCVRAALDAGISTFDTADVYANTMAEDVLGHGVGVYVSRVERTDPRVQGCAHALGRHVVLHLRTVGEPVTVRDLRDLQTAVAEVSIFHTGMLPVPGVPQLNRSSTGPRARLSATIPDAFCLRACG